MKSVLKYIFITAFIFLQTSCNSWLDVYPPNGLIRDEFWKEKEDVEAVLMAAYESFSEIDEKLWLNGELRADMLFGGNSQSSDEEKIMESNIYPDNAFCNWKAYYVIINYCNEVIKNAPEVKKLDNTFTEYHLKSLMAEAYFLRSLTYFYLVRIYNEVPLLLEPAENDGVDIYLPKSTEVEILNQIVKDLKENRDFAPSGSFATLEDTKGRASKVAYDALLADIELWRFNYAEVLVNIAKIEERIDIGLLPSARWFEIFYPGNSFESIFEFQFDDKIAQFNSLAGYTSRFSNRYFTSQKALDLLSLETSFEIVRGENASIARYGDNAYYIYKYIGQSPDGVTVRTGFDTNGANFIVYRLAELMLMKDEALAMLGRYAQSLDIINKIRERANLSPLVLSDSKVAFEDAILYERSIELAFEGKRWFDLLRLGRRNDFARKDKLIEIIISNVPSIQKRILAARLTNPLGWYLPIYDTEIERNRNLKQNPFYVN